jgi:ABC-type polysaccharide/polyol phosphate transport system ATPase subunit
LSEALSFHNVAKFYRGSRGYRTLREELSAPLRRLRGKVTPTDHVRALDGVTFSIQEGDAVAIVGLNGAGKTTTLKLATRITYPTSGLIRIRGRVGALLEVGTGMHPELSGRENIYLYGQILGFSRTDIRARTGDIIEFAGIGDALDRPVKRYSSGMQLRLGFAIAAHLEPDILLVDEAIAVGDVAFQYRCLEKMQELRASGRTLVFVSHDMKAVEALCRRAILLRGGKIVDDGLARGVVERYLQSVGTDRVQQEVGLNLLSHGPLGRVRVSVHDAQGQESSHVPAGESMSVRLHLDAPHSVRGPIVSIGLADPSLGVFALASMLVDGGAPEQIHGTGFVECIFSALPLNPATFEIWASVRGADGISELFEWQLVKRFQVTSDVERGGVAEVATRAAAPVNLDHVWRTVGLDAPDPPAGWPPDSQLS